MRIWRKFVELLTRDPFWFAADGHTLGLGLAAALEKTRQNPATDVEEFLRKRAADDERQRISS